MENIVTNNKDYLEKYMLFILRKCCVDEKKKDMVINVVKLLHQYLPTADELKTIIKYYQNENLKLIVVFPIQHMNLTTHNVHLPTSIYIN